MRFPKLEVPPVGRSGHYSHAETSRSVQELLFRVATVMSRHWEIANAATQFE
jgi:hypothetical protein